MPRRAHAQILSAAVEGDIDEAVFRRLAAEAGIAAGPVYGKMGKQHLRTHIHGYDHAARFFPWLVLVDLDRDADCAPSLRQSWLPRPVSSMCFRIAVREIEAWLLADRGAIAKFLSVSAARVPLAPELEQDPKAVVVALASRSRSSAIRADIVPRPGSKRQVGPAYTSRMMEFVSQHWRPAVAARAAESLERCRRRIAEIARSP
jgi:hypothetical protein